MIVYKISWLPYIFIIGGAGILISDGELDSGAYIGAIFFIVIGFLWLFLKAQNKKAKSEASSTGMPVSNNNPAPTAPRVYTPPVTSNSNVSVSAAKGSPKFCRFCGAKLLPESVFCPECGRKL